MTRNTLPEEGPSCMLIVRSLKEPVLFTPALLSSKSSLLLFRSAILYDNTMPVFMEDFHPFFHSLFHLLFHSLVKGHSNSPPLGLLARLYHIAINFNILNILTLPGVFPIPVNHRKSWNPVLFIPGTGQSKFYS